MAKPISKVVKCGQILLTGQFFCAPAARTALNTRFASSTVLLRPRRPRLSTPRAAAAAPACAPTWWHHARLCAGELIQEIAATVSRTDLRLSFHPEAMRGVSRKSFVRKHHGKALHSNRSLAAGGEAPPLLFSSFHRYRSVGRKSRVVKRLHAMHLPKGFVPNG